MQDVSREFFSGGMQVKVSAFDCTMDRLTKREAVELILGWMQTSARCRYIVTPNVHHLVLLQRCPSLRNAYRNASLTIVDGRPVSWALRLLGKSVPEVIPGSDLVPAIFDAASPERRFSVFLLGAAPGVAELARQVIGVRWPCVRVVGAYSPPPSFESDEAEQAHIIDIIGQAAPDLLIIGLGCPKQEIWISRFAERMNARVAICAGATIDFISGRRTRAPRWMRNAGLEWLYRALCEPFRLGRRYLDDLMVFPVIIAREALGRQRWQESPSLHRASDVPGGSSIGSFISVPDSGDAHRLRRGNPDEQTDPSVSHSPTSPVVRN